MSELERLKLKRVGELEALKLQWRELLPDFEVPRDGQFWLWLRLHGGDKERILFGFRQAQKKHASEHPLESLDHAVRYSSALMRKFIPPNQHKHFRLANPALPEKLFVEERAA